MKLKESIKSMSNYNNSDNIETQVGYDMISRKLPGATVAVPAVSIRSVAVPLSAVPSACQLLDQTSIVEADYSSKSVQAFPPVPSQKSVQTSTSSIVPSVSDGKLFNNSKSFSSCRIDEGLRDEILQWLEDNSDPKLKKLRDAVMKKLTKRYKKMSVANFEKLSVKSENKECHDNYGKKMIDVIINEINGLHLHGCKAVDCDEIVKATRSDQNFEHTGKVLINDISIKKHNLFERKVYDAFAYNIKQWSGKHTKAYRKQLLRTEILNLLHDVPIDFHELSKIVYLNTVAEAFVTKVSHAPVEHQNSTNRCDKDPDQSRYICDVQKNPCQPNINQLKKVIADSLIEFTNKIKAKLKPESVEGIIKDLTDTLLDAISRLNLCDENFATELTTLIRNATMSPENETTKFATPLGQMKDIFNENEGGFSCQLETDFVLQDASLNRSRGIINKDNNIGSNSGKADSEKSSELDIYRRQLSEQIDEWVCSLNIPLADNEEYRKTLVNDLAGDIVDRFNYLELNKDCVYKTDELEHLKYQIFKWMNKLVGVDNNQAIKDAAELFERIKGIKKPGMASTHDENIKPNTDASSSQKTIEKNMVRADGDDNSVICECSKYETNSNTRTFLGKRKDSDQIIQMNADKNTQTDFDAYGENYLEKIADAYPSGAKFNSIYGNWRDFQYISMHIDQSTQTLLTILLEQGFQTNEEQGPSPSGDPIAFPKRDCCKPLTPSLKPQSFGPSSPATPSIKQLNDEYEDYLNNWVKDIPIQTNNPEEVAVAEKARIGILHGIWKAIARVKCEPAVFHNRFYYEDVLEDAIDELLDILPQTPELQDKRYMLKAKLIEKTMDITELIKTVATPASYKQQLAQQVEGNLQRRTVKTEEEDPKQLYEEMLIQCIAEDFILASCYKDEDKLKASAYRNKVKKKVEELIGEAKKIHGKDAKDLNQEICIEEIITALRKVPAPSDATLKEEADEIILGHEIDQWFADLPVVKNDDPQEKLLLGRLKDALTIKLHELEKNLHFADCCEEPEFKHEISLFLDKVPLEKDESLNINFMVNELANRIKNRERPGYTRKSVAFNVEDPECCRIRRGQDQDNGQGQDDGQGQDNLQTDTPEEARFTLRPFDEHDYNEFHKDKPANSTMINPPSDPPQYNYEPLPDFRQWGLDSHPSEKWYSFDSAGNVKKSKEAPQQKFTYVPRQFQEQHLGGKFGDVAQSPGAEMQQSSPQYAQYDARDSANATRQGASIRNYFDNSGNYIPSPDDYKQSNPAPQKIIRTPLFNNQSAMQEPQGLDVDFEGENKTKQDKSPDPADDRPMDMSSFRKFTSGKQASSSWQEPEDEYHSLLYDGPPRPTQIQHRTHYEPYELPPEEVRGGRFALEGKRLSHGLGKQTNNPSTYNPESGNVEEPPNYLEGGFIKLPTGMNRDQSNPKDFDLPKSLQMPHSPGSHRIISRPSKMADNGPEADSQRSSDRVGIKQTIEQYRSPAIGRNLNAVPEDGPPIRPYGIKITEPIENSQSTSSQRPDQQDQRFQTQPSPQTGLTINNQPVGWSTPNQRLNNDYAPNIKERRQVERDKHSRRDYGIDDDQPEGQGCLCMDIPIRCKRRQDNVALTNLKDRREIDRPYESDHGTDDNVEGARNRCQCVDETRRCDTWYDYEDCLTAGIPLIYPYPYFSHPYFNFRKKNSRYFSSRYPGFSKRCAKFPR